MHLAQSAIGCDNSPAVSWTTRMATRSDSPVAYRLIKGLAMHQCSTPSAPTAIFHVSGVNSILADVASCPVPGVTSHFYWLEKLPNANFSHYFNAKYPFPQQRCWTKVQLPSTLWFNVISTLHGQRLVLRQWMKALDKPHGQTGLPTPNYVGLPLDVILSKASQTDLPYCLCHQGLNWHLWACCPSWLSVGGKIPPPHGTNPPYVGGR
jgi:hypothetical protein